MFRPAAPGQVCSLGYRLIGEIRRDLGLTLTIEQQRRLVEFYRLDPVSGARVVRRAALRRPKGAGKSPEGGYVGYAEFCLPTQFAGWSKDGQPIGAVHPDPWVQFAAVSEDQTDNVMVWLFDILADRPETQKRHNIDLGRSRLYFHDRSGRIEPVTAAAGSREGQRITFSVLDQSESWTKENGGERLAATLRRNAAKMGGWTLELQNSPLIGDGSVADKTAKASERLATGVLFDTREPVGADTLDLSDPVALRSALEFAYGEAAAWVDLDRLVAEIQDPDTDPSDARRYYLNVAAPSSDWAFDRDRWLNVLGDGEVAAAGELIVAGFDGARRDDATAIVAVGVESGHAWEIGCWEKPDHDDDWEVPADEVSAAVAEMFDRWQVWRFNCDPFWWSEEIAGWQAKHLAPGRKPAVSSFATNQWRHIGMACHGLASAIRAEAVRHHVDHVDDPLTVHVRNAVKRSVAARDDSGRPLWTLNKPAPGRKIDAAMALVLAWAARTEAVAAGAKKQGAFRPFQIR